MVLIVVIRQGNVLSGWDGEGVFRRVTVPHALADRVGQELCYVKSVTIIQGRDW